WLICAMFRALMARSIFLCGCERTVIRWPSWSTSFGNTKWPPFQGRPLGWAGVACAWRMAACRARLRPRRWIALSRGFARLPDATKRGKTANLWFIYCMFYFSGIGDEAANLVGDQIRAIKTLGWENLEARGVEVPGYPK